MRKHRSNCHLVPTAVFAAFSSLALALSALSASAHEGPEKHEHYQPQIELGFFGGAHFFSSDNALGRFDKPYFNRNNLNHNGMLGLRLAYTVHPYVSLEGELAIIPTNTHPDEIQVVAFGWRGNLLVHILKGCIRPFVLVGGGGFTLSSADPRPLIGIANDTDGEVHAGVGLKVNVTNHFGLRLDGRIQFSPATAGIFFTQDYEINAGIFGLFGGKQTCNCKYKAPVSAPPPVDNDTDKDGVTNDKDLCPTVAGVVENNGCPDKDTDGDGIIDRLDECKTEPGPSENKGCPDKDTDGDSIIDRLDRCPTEKGSSENGGCPDTDADNDGVVDRLDRCVNEPETKNGYQDEDGCPDEIPQAVKQFTGRIEGIFFQTGKAVILAKSFAVLDAAAKVLVEYPTVKLEISGHTDTNGKRETNLTLSQARADAVKDYIVKKGIDTSRLVAKGYGPDKPMADNKTSAGKAQNRRVEFTLIP